MTPEEKKDWKELQTKWANEKLQTQKDKHKKWKKLDEFLFAMSDDEIMIWSFNFAYLLIEGIANEHERLFYNPTHYWNYHIDGRSWLYREKNEFRKNVINVWYNPKRKNRLKIIEEQSYVYRESSSPITCDGKKVREGYHHYLTLMQICYFVENKIRNKGEKKLHDYAGMKIDENLYYYLNTIHCYTYNWNEENLYKLSTKSYDKSNYVLTSEERSKITYEYIMRITRHQPTTLIKDLMIRFIIDERKEYTTCMKVRLIYYYMQNFDIIEHSDNSWADGMNDEKLIERFLVCIVGE